MQKAHIRPLAASQALVSQTKKNRRVAFSVRIDIETVLSAEDWKQNALGVINKILREPLKLELKNVIGGGDQEWAVIELEANGVAKNGT